MEVTCEICGITKDSFSMPLKKYGIQLCWGCKKKEDEKIQQKIRELDLEKEAFWETERGKTILKSRREAEEDW